MKAVVFVDVQKDFIDGALRNERAIEVTPKSVEFAKMCAADPECRLYATRDTHEKTEYKEYDVILNDDPSKKLPNTKFRQIQTGYLSTLEGQKLPVEHCIEGEPGWMLDDRLMDVLEGKCTFVNKPTFGSFDLAEIINEDFFETCQHIKKLHCNVKCLPNVDNQKLDEIVLCGFVSSICIAANAIILRAKFPNVKITVMKDLCAGITNEDHIAAMKVLKMQQIEIK